MNTNEIEKMIKDSKNERSFIIKEKIKPIDEKISILEKKRIESIIKNKEYIFDLSKYNGKSLSDITAIDKEGKEIFLPIDEIVIVDNGRLVCSSYINGIVDFSNDKQKYIYSYKYQFSELEIIGFIDIVVEDEE